MAAAATAATEPAAAGETTTKPGRGRLILIAVPLLLAAVFAGLWFTGTLPKLLGLQHGKPKAEAAAAPIYVTLPEILANLNGNPRRPSYVKLTARIEVASQDDADRVRQVLPAIQDLFQTYLREMHPDELRGSAGTYRLREELLSRANIAAAPAKIRNVLFVQMLVQ